MGNYPTGTDVRDIGGPSPRNAESWLEPLGEPPTDEPMDETTTNGWFTTLRIFARAIQQKMPPGSDVEVERVQCVKIGATDETAHPSVIYRAWLTCWDLGLVINRVDADTLGELPDKAAEAVAEAEARKAFEREFKREWVRRSAARVQG